MKRLALLAWLAATASVAPAVAAEVGAWLLAEPPDARTVALGSAGVALDSLDANTFYNPAAISSGPRLAATWTHCNLSPWWFHEMSYDHAGLAARLGDRLAVAANLQYAQFGVTEVMDEHGVLQGSYRSYDLATGVTAAYRFAPSLSAGMTLKGIYSLLVPGWVWDVMPELGIENGGDGFTFAIDAGAQYRPQDALTMGFAVANLGPNIRYDASAGDMLPRLARFGFAARPPVPVPVSATVTGELSRDLFLFSSGERRDLYHWGVGLELGFVRLAFVRLGYFYNSRVEKGFTWGVGLERHGIRLDVGIDSGFYGELGTRDVRFELSASF